MAFEKRKTTLTGFESPASVSKTTTQPFIAASTGIRKATTTSGNGSLKYKTSGYTPESVFLDQFANMSKWLKPRKAEVIFADQAALDAVDPNQALRFAFYVRTISRKAQSGFHTTLPDAVTSGAGLRNEGIYRIMWYGLNKPEVFKQNLTMIPVVGAWKDLIEMMSEDITFHGVEGMKLPMGDIVRVILAGLENPATSELVKKYLPSIPSKSRCKTVRSQARRIIAVNLANNLNVTHRDYRKFKATGTAHAWQKLVSQALYDQIDFDTVQGRALMLLTSSKFLEKHGLTEKYNEWLAAKPVAKFTGYAHELLFQAASSLDRSPKWKKLEAYQKNTINKQFQGLLDKAQEGTHPTRLLVCRDTSGSMSANVTGQTFSASALAGALTVYFSNMLQGPFKHHYYEFANKAKIRTTGGGKDYVKQFKTVMTHSDCCDTNFLAIAQDMVRVKKAGVSEEDSPTGILVLSDGEFNPSKFRHESNVTSFRRILRQGGYSMEYLAKLKFIFWDIPNSYYSRGKTSARFETYGDHSNIYYLSGFDGNIVGFLMGKEWRNKDGEVVTAAPKSATELLEAALYQPLFDLLV